LERCEAVAAGATSRLAGRGRVSSLVVEGHPIDALSRIAADRGVDLVVVGPHGRGRLESLLMGSVSEGLLHAVRSPVLVARAIGAGLREVVLATDGSHHSRAAARLLADLPLPEGAHVTCVTAVRPHDGPYGTAWPPDLLAKVDAEERAAAEAALEDATRLLPPDTTCEIRTGDAKQQILEVAAERQADLIVVGARGLGGFAGLVVGSVSRAVAKAAGCSVLVVHRP
jgi:nucleotide-binding universal stress UspA family protein